MSASTHTVADPLFSLFLYSYCTPGSRKNNLTAPCCTYMDDLDSRTGRLCATWHSVKYLVHSGTGLTPCDPNTVGMECGHVERFL